MSWQATAWAAAQITGSPTRKVVLLALANYADADGRCWPSQQTLARDTETSERTIRCTLADLEALGLIRRIARRNPLGEVVTTAYRLHVTQPPAKLSGGETRCHRPLDTASTGQSLAGKQSVNNHNQAAAFHARTRGLDTAAALGTGATGKKRNDRPSGIVVWEPDDSLEEAEVIERQYDQATITAAVDAVWKRRKHPVPGLVLAEIKRQALERTQATKEHEQRERDQAAIVARGQLRAEQDAEVAAYLQALDEDAHAALVAQFVEQLPEHNKPAFKSYRQDGLKSKFVAGPFRQFVLARLHPDAHDHLQPTN